MLNRNFFALAFALMGMFFATLVVAHEYKAGAIEIDHPWTRATARAGMNAAGFMTLTNTGAAADRLIAAEAEFAERVELHRSSMADGVMKMERQEDGIALPPGETVALAPGGLHVMFIGTAERLDEGGKVAVTLVFERAGRIAVELAIDKAGAKGPKGGHKH